MDSQAHSCKRLKRLARGSRKGQQLYQSDSKVSFRCKNILAARSVPLLFILVCFLVIANTRCDQAGGANENALSVVTLNPLLITYDTFKRHNIVAKSTVQKFHPNGRYGRRSVDNFAEPHVELGRLTYNEDEQTDSQQVPVRNGAREASALRAILKAIGSGTSGFDPHLSAVAAAHARDAPKKYQSSSSSPIGPRNSMGSNSAQAAHYQLEMNKLLKCNFTGISNLYWCDVASSN